MLTRELFPMKGLDYYLNAYEPFADLWPRFAFPRRFDASEEWRPVADIIERDGEYLVKAELPEVKREDIKIELTEGLLTIKGERKMQLDEEKDTVHRVETRYGSFMRAFTVPKDVDPARIKAEVAEGVLTVHLPKKPATVVSKPVEIPVH
jgi:HSP20 family protein